MPRKPANKGKIVRALRAPLPPPRRTGAKGPSAKQELKGPSAKQELTNRRLRQPSVSERAVIVRLNGTRGLWGCHEKERWEAGRYEAERPCWRAIPASSGLLPVAEKGMSRFRRR